MGERIAKKAYELYEQRERQAERDLEDRLKVEELVRKEMTRPLNERTPVSLAEPFRSLKTPLGWWIVEYNPANW